MCKLTVFSALSSFRSIYNIYYICVENVNTVENFEKNFENMAFSMIFDNFPIFNVISVFLKRSSQLCSLTKLCHNHLNILYHSLGS